LSGLGVPGAESLPKPDLSQDEVRGFVAVRGNREVYDNARYAGLADEERVSRDLH
jgi:hypothetical protein